MKFRVNDKVIVIKKGSHMQDIGDTGRVVDKDGSKLPYRVRMDKDNDCWWFADDEIKLDEIKVGDLVKINKNATIDDFTKNHWNGSQCSTLDFIRDFVDNELIFTVTSSSDNNLMLDYNIGPINKNIFYKVNNDKVKEMTKEEIEKELGYKIKII